MLLFPDLPSLKLVEPGRDEGVVRVETIPSRSWLNWAATKEWSVSKPSLPEVEIGRAHV